MGKVLYIYIYIYIYKKKRVKLNLSAVFYDREYKTLDVYYAKFNYHDSGIVQSPISTRFFPESGVLNPNNHRNRKRSFSVSTSIGCFESIPFPIDHPALQLSYMAHLFGPLIFPLYRAALCRKRILIVTHAPVHMACDFVYNISLISNISESTSSHLPFSLGRLRTLYLVSLSDVDTLEAISRGQYLPTDGIDSRGYLACTSDSILASKPNLYDLLVTLPPESPYQFNGESAFSRLARDMHHPILSNALGVTIRPTNEDSKRWIQLQSLLGPIDYSRKYSDFNDIQYLYSNNIQDWCCNGFLWWATAGEGIYEESDDEGEEYGDLENESYSHPEMEQSDQDAALFSPIWTKSIDHQSNAFVNVSIVVYFHRQTRRLGKGIRTFFEKSQAPEALLNKAVISADDVRKMGYNINQQTDRDFLSSFTENHLEWS